MDIMSKADPFAYVYLIRNDKAPDNILVEKGWFTNWSAFFKNSHSCLSACHSCICM